MSNKDYQNPEIITTSDKTKLSVKITLILLMNGYLWLGY